MFWGSDEGSIEHSSGTHSKYFFGVLKEAEEEEEGGEK